MPLTIIRRASTGALTISGTVAGNRVRRRAESDDPKLAWEEATALEAEILRTAWHGERRGSRTFAEAVTSYLEAAPRSDRTKATVRRLLLELGPAVRLSEVDQDTAARLKSSVLRPGAKPATYLREVVVPLRAILRHAVDRGWSTPTRIATPKTAGGRTRYLMPEEAEQLYAAAGFHLRPLLLFLIGTGARMSEALELEWRDVDLIGGRAIFWRTKTGNRRVAALPPRVSDVLAALPHRAGRVFRHRNGHYEGRDRGYGGQIKTAWRGALRRAGLDPELTPHDLRHTWASWHYALNRDLLALKQDGGWSSVALVERYAHLLPAGQAGAIRQFLGWHRSDTAEAAARGTA